MSINYYFNENVGIFIKFHELEISYRFYRILTLLQFDKKWIFLAFMYCYSQKKIKVTSKSL